MIAWQDTLEEYNEQQKAKKRKKSANKQFESEAQQVQGEEGQLIQALDEREFETDIKQLKYGPLNCILMEEAMR